MEGFGFDRIAFLESRQAVDTRVRTSFVQGTNPNPHLNGRSLRCEYKSLSGRCYFTVTDFDSEGAFVSHAHLSPSQRAAVEQIVFSSRSSATACLSKFLSLVLCLEE
jgi:hypothetical protein